MTANAKQMPAEFWTASGLGKAEAQLARISIDGYLHRSLLGHILLQ
jgi:hypothetical protein